MKILVGILGQNLTLTTRTFTVVGTSDEAVMLWLYEHCHCETAVSELLDLSVNETRGLLTPYGAAKKSRARDDFLDKIVRGARDAEDVDSLFVYQDNEWWAYRKGITTLIALPLQHLKHKVAKPMTIAQTPQVLFLGCGGKVYTEDYICGDGTAGEVCEYSDKGKFPGLIVLDESQRTYTLDKGKPGDLCPSCAKQNLSDLGYWQGHQDSHYPDELLPLRLFKCRQWVWLVVRGLREDNPTELAE
jgi:hypothetical protein